jgi:hypothetical protein
MLFALGHIHERRQITIRIEAQMQFDRPLGLTETGSREHRKAELYRCGVKKIDFTMTPMLGGMNLEMVPRMRTTG